MTHGARFLRGVAIAITLVAIATVLQALAVRFGGVNLPLLLYYPILACVAWATSFPLGLAATAASGALAWTLFLSDPSAYTQSLPERLIRLGTFVLAGVLACAIATMLRRARFVHGTHLRRESIARRQYEAMLQSLAQGVLASDLQGRVTFVNARAEALAGCTQHDAIGRPVHDVLRVYDGKGRRVRVTPLDRVLDGGDAAISDQHWLMHDGEPMPIVEIASPILDESGNVDGAVLLLRDARAERARADANRTVRAVIDASPDALIGIDAARRIVSWNPAAQRMFGYDTDDVLGRDVAMLVAARWLRRHPLDDAFRDMRHMVGPLDLLCVGVDGERFRATVAACPPQDGMRERVALALGVRRAADQRRRDRRAQRSLRGARDARRQAVTSNRLKDELLAMVSHELRTPLNVIYGWVEVLRNSADASLHRQAVDAIDRSARSLSRMVGDILDVSSLATGKLRLEAMPVDLVRIVTDVTDVFRKAASANDIVLDTDCAVDACVVSGDGDRLRQMLSNLLSNALKFTPRGGRVTVGLARAGSEAVLTVADTGQGIARGFIPKVFDAFSRADESPASPRRGLGLGLSIVRHIVELHGGAVTVESGGRNHGATFTVVLPIGWQPVGVMAWLAEQAEDDEPMALDGQHVLLVDDDATTRTSLSAALTTLGAQVDVASSGREAMEMVAQVRPTVVLSDLAMPDGDGFWLLDALRHDASGAGVRVLAVTAHAGLADEHRVREAGFDGYLRKPVDVRELAEAIAHTTDGSG
ncbi:PAS domain-containing hybrid sensor histidine kinase/response regulator [Burkholderia stagnalis]|uniref:hybrid sensor histidine kinase/response regulator n=1 Tax=Burkholderia stagnalis TaxID=1503054 RepID=UPI0007534032|nr:PAS domain-containing hybrid sensor histidine kinase/response regulator [Burkholderia stagnalis]KWI31001.1 hybrid sensor histidine kinase/response regulator [Burkholderia stagnalis]KWI80467.1 hybrid sensor histidine kinase/response regulator [Burkholderia stagnalis]